MTLDSAELHDAGIQRVAHMLDQVSGGPVQRAEQIIKVYLAASPAWPSRETMLHVYGSPAAREFTDKDYDAVRRALLADPIIQAAIAMRDAQREIIDDPGLVPTNTYPKSRVAVMDAVNEAGL